MRDTDAEGVSAAEATFLAGVSEEIALYPKKEASPPAESG